MPNRKNVLYTVKDIAPRLSYSIWTVYKQIKKGQIPGAEPMGGGIRIRATIFDAWIDGNGPSISSDEKAA